MKNKFANDRFSYVVTPRIHGNVLAWVKPASMSERSKRANESIMRWEDDGGPISETWHPLSKLQGQTNTAQQMDGAE